MRTEAPHATGRAVGDGPAIAPLDDRLRDELRRLVDGKAKPPGSLGALEGLAVRLGAIRGTHAACLRARRARHLRGRPWADRRTASRAIPPP